MSMEPELPMNDQISPKQPVICEFCGVSVRYDRLIKHVQRVHDAKPLTKPVTVSQMVFSSRPKITSKLKIGRRGGKSLVKHIIAVPVDKLKKCPHGVPEIQTCAICEPDKWRMENGY